MILPIVAYGANVLKVKASIVDKADPNLDKLIEDMWETMYLSLIHISEPTRPY